MLRTALGLCRIFRRTRFPCSSIGSFPYPVTTKLIYFRGPFDAPVVGLQTLETAQAAGFIVIGIESTKTLLLEREQLLEEADARKITLHGL